MGIIMLKKTLGKVVVNLLFIRKFSIKNNTYCTDFLILFKIYIIPFETCFIETFLVSLYSYYFGQHSIQKYLDKGTIIINYEEEPDTIPPPAVVIFPMNSKTTPEQHGGGWKYNNQSNCNDMAGEDFIKCFNTISYSAEDVIYY